MRSFSVILVLAALFAIAFAIPKPMYHAIDEDYTLVPFDPNPKKKRDPTAIYENIDEEYHEVAYDPNPKKAKRYVLNPPGVPLFTRDLTSPLGGLVKRTATPDGTCGPAHGYTCTNLNYGMCCSINVCYLPLSFQFFFSLSR